MYVIVNTGCSSDVRFQARHFRCLGWLWLVFPHRGGDGRRDQAGEEQEVTVYFSHFLFDSASSTPSALITDSSPTETRNLSIQMFALPCLIFHLKVGEQT